MKERLPYQTTDSCAACHQKQEGNVVELFSHSVHAQKGIACSRCHGGDSSATDKQAAHSGRFVGQPSSEQVLTICGSCHREQLATFKTSRHFPERRGVTRVDCVQCHGAHTVGSPKRNFSFAYYCSGCHGLEYLPELPSDFLKMLNLADDLTEAMNARANAGAAPAEEAIQRRKEISRMIARIVHGTDLKGGGEEIPRIVESGNALKRILEIKK
ncbi:MAG TPA: ammonia-forming cytochrome c nitrite reductase subunit c552 [Blastocatellia bacterium]|nr:ammonia-forming cytochrome c nitrite reductase subunit c552 [Blastocatellia bacterium]